MQDCKPKAVKFEPECKQKMKYTRVGLKKAECESDSRPSSKIKNEHNEDVQLEDTEQGTNNCIDVATEQNKGVKIKVKDEKVQIEKGADSCNENAKIEVKDENVKKENGTDYCNGAATEQQEDVNVKVKDEMVKKESGNANCYDSDDTQQNNEDVNSKLKMKRLRKNHWT